MLIGIALLAATTVLRGAAKNRHIRAKLFASAAVFAVYASLAIVLRFVALDAELRAQLDVLQPLLLIFGLINLIVALAVNPWREDRIPDRFPNIVQDASVVLLFAAAAALILRDRLLAATAAGAVVLGLALQDTLGNLIAGLAIQVEKPFRVGHWVRLGNQDGMVSEITWRATKIRTKAGNFVIVPNSVLSKDTITNYSEPTPHTRVEVEIGVDYDAAPNDVRATIVGAIRDEPLIERGRPIEVLVNDFGAYAITYLIRVWTTDFSADQILRDRIRTAVYYAFRRRGIGIPYPVQVQVTREWSAPQPDHRKLASAIGAAQMFAALSDAQRDAVLKTARSSVYGSGEAIVREGEAGSSMFVIAGGEAAVTLNRLQEPVARLRAGDVFGEMSLLTGDPRSATVTAVTDCDLVELTAEGFRSVVMSDPVVADLVCRAVEGRRAELEARRASIHDEPSAAPAESRSLLTRMREFLRF